MDIPALIEELNQTDEHQHIEAKRGTEAGKAVMKTVSAFSNEPDLGGGYILFGLKRDETTLFPSYDIVGVDYIRVPGREWIGHADERYTSTVEMRGPIIEVIRRAQAAVMDDLPRGFSLGNDDVHRREPTALPRRALREAIVNAVMHRDYRVHQPTQIIRYSNRVEVVNAGYSLKAEDDLGEVGSLQRSPTIATALHETGIAETKGSGIRVMRREMEEADLAPPTFESDREANKFTTRLLMHHFLGADDRAWLKHFETLSAEQMKALVFVREVGAIDNPTFRQLSGADTLEASTALRDLREKDLLEKRGGGKATYYLPTETLLDPWEEMQGTRESTYDEPKTELSQEGTSPDKGGSSLDKKKSSPDKTESSLDKKVPAEIREELEELGQRTNPQQFRRVLRRLCDWQSLRAGEIAELTGRDVKYLVQQYLTPMIEDDELEYTIPEMPNHPKQAYRTSDD